MQDKLVFSIRKNDQKSPNIHYFKICLIIAGVKKSKHDTIFACGITIPLSFIPSHWPCHIKIHTDPTRWTLQATCTVVRCILLKRDSPCANHKQTQALLIKQFSKIKHKEKMQFCNFLNDSTCSCRWSDRLDSQWLAYQTAYLTKSTYILID